jgi:integrase/recombinase XerD
MTGSDIVILPTRAATSPCSLLLAPATIDAAGPVAAATWDEFFLAAVRNPHTRAAYLHAARRFFAWLGPHDIPLHNITPALVGRYFDQLAGSTPTRKLHLAALRRLFDLFVTRHLMVLNPAASVRGERYQVEEGKTPEITQEQATKLLKSIAPTTLIALRDRAIVGVLIFTAARAGAVAKLHFKHLSRGEIAWSLRFDEKGGKSREIPVRSDLQQLLAQYIEAASLREAPANAPFFRTAFRKSGRLTSNAMTGADICRMVKRRIKAAGLPERLSPHSFRVFAITNLLSQDVALEDVQYLCGHSDPRTTRLYDRRRRRVTRNLVERRPRRETAQCHSLPRDTDCKERPFARSNDDRSCVRLPPH